MCVVCVLAQLKYSALCMSHKMDKFCDGSDSVKTFSCHYTTNPQEISVTGWSITLKNDGWLPGKKHLALRNKCVLKTAESMSCDTFVYYYTEAVAQTQPHCATCSGLSRWRLHVLSSPVSIVVERLLHKQNAVVSSWNVTAGQRIRLTCVPTCTSKLRPRSRPHLVQGRRAAA